MTRSISCKPADHIIGDARATVDHDNVEAMTSLLECLLLEVDARVTLGLSSLRHAWSTILRCTISEPSPPVQPPPPPFSPSPFPPPPPFSPRPPTPRPPTPRPPTPRPTHHCWIVGKAHAIKSTLQGRSAFGHRPQKIVRHYRSLYRH